jgi:hypothetical protein
VYPEQHDLDEKRDWQREGISAALQRELKKAQEEGVDFIFGEHMSDSHKLDMVNREMAKKMVRRKAIPEIRGIKGVGKDAEVETLPNGAKHSRLNRAFHLLPALALSKIAEILHEGADKYEPVELLNSVRANWRGIPTHSHVNHALQHLVAYLAEDTQDDHLGHAVARLMFALELREGGNAVRTA